MEHGTTPNGNGYHWDSRCVCLHHDDPETLCSLMNECYKGKFVVGTQTHYDPKKKRWVAFIYFKVKA